MFISEENVKAKNPDLYERFINPTYPRKTQSQSKEYCMMIIIVIFLHHFHFRFVILKVNKCIYFNCNRDLRMMLERQGQNQGLSKVVHFRICKQLLKIRVDFYEYAPRENRFSCSTWIRTRQSSKIQTFQFLAPNYDYDGHSR